MSASDKTTIRPCPICGKMVDPGKERHTLNQCRNFLLGLYFKEMNPERRQAVEKRIDLLNERLSLHGKNLLDA